VATEKDIPPLGTLRVFEAAARHKSFLLAAGELNVTPSAVSKQVKQLELFLGTPLFERRHREIELTKAGAQYFEGISQVVLDIRALTSALASKTDRDHLTLWCSPWFLKSWLLPRLDRFRAISPNIQFDMLTGESSQRISPQADIAIRLGNGRWPSVKSEALTAQEVTAVCTPQYLEISGLRAPFRFDEFVILDSANTPHHFELWKAAAGFEDRNPRERIVFQSNETAFAAALRHHGLALVNPRFVEAELSRGELIRPWDVIVETGKKYFLTYNKRYSLLPAARLFRSWILDEFK